MKRCSFEIAKAIKEAGYLQYNFGHHYLFNGESDYGALTENDIAAPTYTDVWLWLWREKKIFIETAIHFDSVKGYYFTAFIISDNISKHIEASDPEEAIIAAIHNLVENNFIK